MSVKTPPKGKRGRKARPAGDGSGRSGRPKPTFVESQACRGCGAPAYVDTIPPDDEVVGVDQARVTPAAAVVAMVGGRRVFAWNRAWPDAGESRFPTFLTVIGPRMLQDFVAGLDDRRLYVEHRCPGGAP